MLSGHFQNSLEDDCKAVFTDANTKEATENKVNGYGRSVCDREKQRRPSFKKRNQEILNMEKTSCGPLLSSFMYVSTVTHTHLAIHLVTMKKLMSGSSLNFRYKEGNCSTFLWERIVEQRLKKNVRAKERKKGWVKDTKINVQGTVCVYHKGIAVSSLGDSGGHRGDGSQPKA